MERASINKGCAWLSSVDDHVSLLALGLGFGIGFIGVVSAMLLWDRARSWMMPPKTKPFYGVYKFPK